MSLKIKSDTYYHIYNQGNNSQRIFLTDQNYLFFLKKMRRHLLDHSRILAYCLMPNHFHWLIYINKDPLLKKIHPLVSKIATLLSSYTQAINKQTGRSGSLFRQKTKAVPLDTQRYALTCFHYIHQNPIRAGLVSEMGYWPYSSFLDYAGKRDGTLIDKQLTFQTLNIRQHSFISQSQDALDPRIVKDILSPSDR